MSSLFTKIVNREIPAHIVAEDDNFLAFLDINPLVEGHTLVIPKKETDYIFDMEDNSLKDIMVFAKKVAKGIEESVECKRIGVAVVGLEVPHAHIHLVPINQVGDINFTRPKLKPEEEDLRKMSEKIRKVIGN